MAAIESSEPILDVAVVGAGISGLYSAWRLVAESGSQGTPPAVAVFECSHRVGGRLLSVIPPGIPQTRVELGGMRYTSSHKRVASLAEYLQLARDDFPVGQPQNIAYVRGKMLRRQDLVDANKLPYNLAPDERGEDVLAGGFAALAAQRIVRSVLGKDVPLDKVDWNDLAQKHLYQNKSLSDLPMQYVMERSISLEAFKFAEDTSGYDSILHTWNAADGLPWNLSDFGQPVSFFHLHDGFEALPQTIADRLLKAGAPIHLRHKLTRFDQVRLPDGSSGIELHFSVDGSDQTVFARKLILAMPRRALELLDKSGAVLGATTEVHDLIGSVTPIPLFKLALCYSFAWWETLDPVVVTSGDGAGKTAIIERGQSVTDLPLRQCYYWAKDQATQNAVVLIYDDGTDLDFWAGLRERSDNTLFQSTGGAAGDDTQPAWEEHKAPHLMVEEAHRQLMIMHGVQDRSDIPPPFAAAYRDWGEDPFGGGANFWRVGVDSNKVFENILQPKPPVPVYICGEAYSHDQGWVEGPLATADAMLERHFGLAPPAWPKP